MIWNSPMNLSISFSNYFSSKYENLITIGDLNISIENVYLNTLLQLLNSNALINSPTCYQSHLHCYMLPIIPTCIDDVLKSFCLNFPKCGKLTGLSDHHKIISTTMKSGSFKGPPKKKKKKNKYFIKTLILQILTTL